MPYDPTSKPLSRHELAAELRQLLHTAERRPGRAARLKRAALARRVGRSVSSLYAYLAGTTLPPAGTLDRLLDALDVADIQRQHLLSARESLELSRRSPIPAPSRDPTLPRQLPPDVPGFTGRVAYLDRLDMLLSKCDSGTATVGITAIGGMAGVGKTALSLHWAHRVADRFPHGQLYVDLCGFSPVGQPVAPADAIRRILDSLGVPPQRIPVDLDAQAALYRSQLAGRRLLIVLDNARDSAQVRPLLPATATCMVVVTSRNLLSGLVAANGALPINLDVLPVDEARQLLAHRLGTTRVAAEPDAVQEIVSRCARLPLALAIVAAHAAARPRVPLHVLAGELADAGQRWQTLTGDDPHTDIRSVFSWSDQALAPDAARLFRLLALHPGPDITGPAAASLAGLAPDAVRPVLAELTRASLLTENAPDRYTFHDLLRAYAVEIAHRFVPEALRRAATHRMLDHYLHTAWAAAALLYPQRDLIDIGPRQPGTTVDDITDHADATAWFTAEYAVLLLAVRHAAATGFHTHAWQLAWALITYLSRHGLWHDAIDIYRTALDSARQLADETAQAHIHQGVGSICTRLGRYDDAELHLQHAIDLYHGCGDQTGQAHTHLILAVTLGYQHAYDDALTHAQQALAMQQTTGHLVGQANALTNIGWILNQQQDHGRAIIFCRKALALHTSLGDQRGQAASWDNLGNAYVALGDEQQAMSCYQHALDLYQKLNDRWGVADVTGHIGDTHRATGNHQAAHDAWQQALSILDDLDHPDVDQLRTKLAGLDDR